MSSSGTKMDAMEYGSTVTLQDRHRVSSSKTDYVQLQTVPDWNEDSSINSDTEVLEGSDTTQPLSKLRVVSMNMAWFGMSTMFLVMSVVVVPSQIEMMVGTDSKGRWLGGMVAGGAVCMFISGPLVGMASDRLSSPYGKRRPVIFCSSIAVCIGLIGMALMCPKVHQKRMKNDAGECHVDLEAQRCGSYLNYTDVEQLPVGAVGGLDVSDNIKKENHPAMSDDGKEGHIVFFIMFYLITATFFTSTTVPLSGLIADKSHPLQRGLNSGVMGFMILFGNITGAGLGLFFTELGTVGIYMSVVGLVLMCVLITVITTREAPAKPIHQPLDIYSVFTGFWAPLQEHDFRWVFITRFLMQQGISTTTGFLEYWLTDMVQLPNCWSPERAVALMMVPLLSTAAFACLLFGAVSDKIQRRKLLVTTSSLAMCVVATTFAFMRGEYLYYVSISFTVLFGLGFGCYQAVDFALVMDVLPDEKDKAKDIAVWHQALILPQAIATPIGGIVLDTFERINCHIGLGYIMLFAITGVYFFLSGVLVRKIKGVR